MPLNYLQKHPKKTELRFRLQQTDEDSQKYITRIND